MAKQKILLVDDAPLMLEMQKNFLYFCPVRVLTARRGEEAIEVARRERPSLIFMDLNLPEMDGAACCSFMKSDPELGSIPIILLTTDWSVGAKAKCLQAGCDDFLLKPLKRHQFLDKGHRFIPGIERRDVRVWCHLNLSLQRNGLQLSATGEDISSGGIYVASDEKVRDDEEVNLTFSLPTATSREIVAKGRVAWRNSGSIRKKPLLPTGFGVEFMGIDDEATETIRQYVTTAISK